MAPKDLHKYLVTYTCWLVGQYFFKQLIITHTKNIMERLDFFHRECQSNQAEKASLSVYDCVTECREHQESGKRTNDT